MQVLDRNLISHKLYGLDESVFKVGVLIIGKGSQRRFPKKKPYLKCLVTFGFSLRILFSLENVGFCHSQASEAEIPVIAVLNLV